MSGVEDDNHKAKMMKRKAAQDAEVDAKPILEKGLLIVHTGPGKGKSTAAFGLVLRGRWRGAVHQGRVVDRRAHRHRALRSPGRVAHDGRGLHLGDAGPRARCRGGERRLGWGQAHDGGTLRSAFLCWMNSTSRCAMITCRLPKSLRRSLGVVPTCMSAAPAATPNRS